MTFGLSGAAIAGIGLGAADLYANYEQGQASQEAAKIQGKASQAGIDEQRRQFDALQKLLSPFVQSGTSALSAQQDLIGLNGPEAQQKAIAAIQSGPQFSALNQQGQNAILQNASATGGLRGGNVQAALSQFSPNLLSQLINDQYTKLGGLSSMGQNAAAGVGNAGMATGTNIANLLGQQGSAYAGGALAKGATNAGYVNALTGGLGAFMGMGGKF